MSELTPTLKIITPSSSTETNGLGSTIRRPREASTETPTSYSQEGEFVLDYKDKHGKPYIAELLGINGELTGELDTIDDWVILEIERRGLNGKKEAYREIVDDLSKKLKLHKSIAPTEKAKAISTLLKKALETQKYYKKLGINLESLEKIYDDISTT